MSFWQSLSDAVARLFASEPRQRSLPVPPTLAAAPAPVPAAPPAPPRSPLLSPSGYGSGR